MCLCFYAGWVHCFSRKPNNKQLTICISCNLNSPWYLWTTLDIRHPRTVLGCLCRLVRLGCPEDPMRDTPGLSWDIPEDWCDLVSSRSCKGHPNPRTVLGRPWRLVWLFVRRVLQGTSQDSPGTSLKIGVTWCPEDPTRDIPGQSWDVPEDSCDLVSRGSHKGYSRTILECPWRLVWLSVRRIQQRIFQDSPGTPVQDEAILNNWRILRGLFYNFCQSAYG